MSLTVGMYSKSWLYFSHLLPAVLYTICNSLGGKKTKTAKSSLGESRLCPVTSLASQRGLKHISHVASVRGVSVYDAPHHDLSNEA